MEERPAKPFSASPVEQPSAERGELEPVAPVEEQPEISKDFDEDAPIYEEDPSKVGAWRTLEQRRKLIIYRKLTGHWPDEVSRETGLQSYYEIRYFSTREEHKRKYAKQHALTRQWWAEYKIAIGETDTAKMGRVKPHLHLVSNE